MWNLLWKSINQKALLAKELKSRELCDIHCGLSKAGSLGQRRYEQNLGAVKPCDI